MPRLSISDLARGLLSPLRETTDRDIFPIVMSSVTLCFGKFYARRVEKRHRFMFLNIYKYLW
jgi:hypothetical protein